MSTEQLLRSFYWSKGNRPSGVNIKLSLFVCCMDACVCVYDHIPHYNIIMLLVINLFYASFPHYCSSVLSSKPVPEVTHFSMNLYLKQTLISLVICSIYYNLSVLGFCHGIEKYPLFYILTPRSTHTAYIVYQSSTAVVKNLASSMHGMNLFLIESSSRLWKMFV